MSGDVSLCMGPDGADFAMAAGLVQLGDGLETAVILSLFGGDRFDDGTASGEEWWGNAGLPVAQRLRGELDHFLATRPPRSANLLAAIQAAERDLSWLTETGGAVSVDVSGALGTLGRLDLTVDVVLPDGARAVTIAANWSPQ